MNIESMILLTLGFLTLSIWALFYSAAVGFQWKTGRKHIVAQWISKAAVSWCLILLFIIGQKAGGILEIAGWVCLVLVAIYLPINLIPERYFKSKAEE